MRIDFPYAGYEGIAPVEIPDANVLGVFAPRTVPDVEEDAVLNRVLRYVIAELAAGVLPRIGNGSAA